MSKVVAPHIHLDGEGVAWVDGTNTKVIEVALDQLVYGFSPEEIHYQHPHISLAKVYAALAYYHDHKQQLDAEIERRYQYAEAMAAKARQTESPVRARLRTMGKLP